MSQLILNGEYYPVESNQLLSTANRAFLYGDGVFETIKLQNKNLLFWEDHYTRMINGAKALSLDCSLISKDELSASIINLAEKNSLSTARIRIQLWRSPGGLFTPLNNSVQYLINASEFTAAPLLKKSCFFFDEVPLAYSSISRYKTCNALPYILASIKRKELEADEMILFNTDGFVSECSSSNIFWIKGETLCTPSLETGCIEGIVRKQILSYAKRIHIKVVEGQYFKEDLLHADFVFSTNTTGISQLGCIEGKQFKEKHPLYDQLIESYTKDVSLQG
ncbi:MAG: aminotransferase class IV family protein [Sporocytophaga sp.]|uniref:aminotransferase class IV n=1 Tax=Sporocytophaga sp. TaxID=2231183 RepID=UPI001B27E610|nr:aminotransferase class IV [Sporocytophaga sp.]MBO9702454.1 aminotransferase class IV family protein [Sporocytophaga sp.]